MRFSPRALHSDPQRLLRMHNIIYIISNMYIIRAGCSRAFPPSDAHTAAGRL